MLSARPARLFSSKRLRALFGAGGETTSFNTRAFNIQVSTNGTTWTTVATVSNNTVCWNGSTTCSTGNNKYGWKMDLPTAGEQVIYNPIVYAGALVLNTTVPADNSPFSCSTNLPTGWTMALSPTSGGALPASFFADASNNFVTINGSVVSGIALNATGSPSVVTAAGSPYLDNQTSSGTGTVNKINPPGGTQGGRLTWTQLR